LQAIEKKKVATTREPGENKKQAKKARPFFLRRSASKTVIEKGREAKKLKRRIWARIAGWLGAKIKNQELDQKKKKKKKL